MRQGDKTVTNIPALPADVLAAASQTNQELMWLRVTDLRVDPRYQRQLDMKRVRKMAKDFDLDAFGVLYVSRRADGGLWLIDGQHRQAVMFEIGYSDQSVPCLVFDGLAFEQEARIFRLANSGSRPNALSLFKAALAEGDPQAADIDRTVRSCGLQIGSGGSHRTIGAIQAVRRVHREAGGLTLKRVLNTIVESWGSAATNFQSDIILALGLIEKRYGKEFNRDRLRQQLTTEVPEQLLARARARKRSGSGNIWATEVPELIVDLYNKGLQKNSKNRLRDWERKGDREVWT
jgi:hypothetical protein